MIAGSRWCGDDVISGRDVSMRRTDDDDDTVIDVVGCDLAACTGRDMSRWLFDAFKLFNHRLRYRRCLYDSFRTNLSWRFFGGPALLLVFGKFGKTLWRKTRLSHRRRQSGGRVPFHHRFKIAMYNTGNLKPSRTWKSEHFVKFWRNFRVECLALLCLLCPRLTWQTLAGFRTGLWLLRMAMEQKIFVSMKTAWHRNL